MSRKRKIVFIDQALGGGGAERVSCTVMRSLDPECFDIHLVLVTRLGALRHLVPSHVTVHELGINNTRKALQEYRNKISEIKPDLVYSTHERTTVLAILARFFSPKHRIVARYPNMPSRQIASGQLVSWRLLLSKLCYGLADVVIAQTEEMAAELRTYFKVGQSKLRVIANPLDKSYIDSCLKGQDNPFDLTDTSLVASGRMEAQKGYDVLLKSVAIIKKQHPDVVLHILGRDVNGALEGLRKQAEQLGVLGSLRFHGFVENPYPYYRYCDLFVLSSRYEGYPNALLESLYLGTKVAATRCVPIIERLVGADRGMLATVGDAEDLALAIHNALAMQSSMEPMDEKSAGTESFRELFLSI